MHRRRQFPFFTLKAAAHIPTLRQELSCGTVCQQGKSYWGRANQPVSSCCQSELLSCTENGSVFIPVLSGEQLAEVKTVD